MESVQIVLPAVSHGELSIGLRGLTKNLVRCGYGSDCGGLGGAYGYGVQFENDVFLMHPYCWCEQQGCPWCTECLVSYPDVPHGSKCYQIRLESLRQEFGEMDEFGLHVPIDSPNRGRYEIAKEALCQELNCSYRLGSEVHCTCGADQTQRQIYDDCQCDWHLGKGVYRFGAATRAPHFWYKPTDFKVWWYKYIGRDQTTNGGAVDIATMFNECVRSLS